MTTVSGRWTGPGVAPGTAVAASWRVDRPIQLGAGPLDPNRVEQAFRDVAGDLNRVANRARAQGRRAGGGIVAGGAGIAPGPGLGGAPWRAAPRDDPPHGIHNPGEEEARMVGALAGGALRE